MSKLSAFLHPKPVPEKEIILSDRFVDEKGQPIPVKLRAVTQQEQEARQEAIQAALGPACDIPLQIMEACSKIIDEADYLAHHGSRLAVSDAGAAAVLARGALVSAAMNIFLNVDGMTDPQRALEYRAKVNELMISAQIRSDIVASQVMGILQ